MNTADGFEVARLVLGCVASVSGLIALWMRRRIRRRR